MAKKTYISHLHIRYDHYRVRHNKKWWWFICAHGLHKKFKFPKGTKKIDIVLNTKPTADSVRVKLYVPYWPQHSIYVDDNKRHLQLSAFAYKELTDFMKLHDVSFVYVSLYYY